MAILSFPSKTADGLIARGVFTSVSLCEPKSFRDFEASLVDTVKNEGAPNAINKFRLVVQAYNDKDHGLLIDTPTVQRMSLRYLLSILDLDPPEYSSPETSHRHTFDQTRMYNAKSL